MQVIRKIITGTSVLAAVAALGAEFTIKDGTADWTLPASYEENAVPGSGDAVKIPANAAVRLDATDTDSWSLVDALTRVRPAANTSVMTIDVPSGTKALGCALTSRDVNMSSSYGRFMKTGDGELDLTSYSNVVEKSNLIYDYYTTLVVSNGVLKLPQSNGRSFYLREIDIAGSDATFYTVNDYSTYVRTLRGCGTLTCTSSESGKCRITAVNGTADELGEFSGKITGDVRFTTNYGYVDLTGVVSDFACGDGVSAGGSASYIGVKMFGMAGKVSSLGTADRLSIRGAGATFRWLGTPAVETKTDKMLIVWNSPAILDGGATGGLSFTGMMRGYDQGTGDSGTTAMMHQLVLAGSNRTACVIAGSIPIWSALNNRKSTYTGVVTNYSFHVTKKGTGVWRFGTGRRRLAGAIAVENGTLQADSVHETNMVSSVGTATILREPYTGTQAPWTMSAAPAFTLGAMDASGATTSTGTFEYTGTVGDSTFCNGLGFSTSDYSWTGTRPVALAGNGTFLNSTARSFRLKGVSPASGATGTKTLTLGGTGTAENELLNVSDTADSPIKVVKDGSGTWYLGGNQSVRGGLEVKAGTLRVRKPDNQYHYYKFTVRDILGSYTNAAGTTYSSKMPAIRQVGLYDADNRRISLDPTWVANVSCLTNNCAAYADNPAYDGDQWTYAKFSSASDRANPAYALQGVATQQLQTCFMPNCTDDNRTTTGYRVRPVESDPATWIAFVWKMPEGSVPACGYDMSIRYGKYKDYHTPYTDDDIYKDNNGAGHVTSWALSGSVDGLEWDELSSVRTNEYAFTKLGTWFYARGVNCNVEGETAATVHKTPGPIASHAATKPSVFAGGVSVSVAAGATLETCGYGDPVTVNGLGLSGASGMGRLNGFALAETGTVDFDALPKGQTAFYEGALAGCSGLANVANWSVTVGGMPFGAVSVSAWADGTVCVVRRGLTINIR